MRLITENDTLFFETKGNYDILDTHDLVINAQVINCKSLIDALKIYAIKLYYAEKNESNRLVYLKKQNVLAIENSKLEDYDKYDKHNTLCTIEHIISGYCRKKNNWMVIYARNEYSVKMVSGYQDLLLNTRCVDTSEDLQREISQTIKYINRTFPFSDVEIITDMDLDMPKIKVDHLKDTLIEYSDGLKWVKNIYGHRRFVGSKRVFATLLAICLAITANEYRLMRNADEELHLICQEIKKYNTVGTPELFRGIREIKSPLDGLKMVPKTSKTTITEIMWDKQIMRIAGSGFAKGIKRNSKGEVEVKTPVMD